MYNLDDVRVTRGHIMDQNKLNLFKAIYNIEINAYNDASAGCYFPGIAKIQINNPSDEMQGLITFAHEMVHRMLGEATFGFILTDFNTIIDMLYSHYAYRASQLLEEFLTSKGYITEEQQLEVVDKLSYEIDEYFSRDKCLVQFLQFVYSIINKYSTLNRKHIILNEGIATYVSLNIDENSQLNEKFIGINFQKINDKNYFKACQNERKKYIQSLDDENPYKIGYNYAEQLYNKFGELNLFRTGYWASSVPFYNYDLIGASDDEFTALTELIYNPDAKWMKMLEYDAEYIERLHTEPALLDRFICDLSGVDDFPEHDKTFTTPLGYTYYYAINHQVVRKNIECIRGEQKKEHKDYSDAAFEKIIKNSRSLIESGMELTSINPLSVMAEQTLNSESMEDFKENASKKAIDYLSKINEIINTMDSELHINATKTDSEDISNLFVRKIDSVNMVLRRRFIKRIELILTLSRKER